MTTTEVMRERGEVLPGVVGRSRAMRETAKLVRRCAQRGLPTLVRGETGTGKELVARALHELGPRRHGPFVAVNAATLSDELGAAALFGHVRGAFTGAGEPRRGAMRRAHGGTLFIDEVAALTPRVQALLLRTLEEGIVCPVGGDEEIPVDLRVVTATCEPLEQRVAVGEFRADLFQRLATFVVRLPPLREREGDLPLLIDRLLREEELAGYRIDERAVQLLVREPLRGNVRELRNLLVQATLIAEEERCIDLDTMAQVIQARRPSSALDRLTPDRAARLVADTGGNVSAAARRAGLARSTFRDLLGRALSQVPDPADDHGEATLRHPGPSRESPPTLRSAGVVAIALR